MRLTPSSIIWTRLGKESRNSPLILMVTSILGLPSSDTGMTSNPVTAPPLDDHTGLRPRRLRTYAMSSPPVFMVSVAQMTTPTCLGYVPFSSTNLRTICSAILEPMSHDDLVGIDAGSMEKKFLPLGSRWPFPLVMHPDGPGRTYLPSRAFARLSSSSVVSFNLGTICSQISETMSSNPHPYCDLLSSIADPASKPFLRMEDIMAMDLESISSRISPLVLPSAEVPDLSFSRASKSYPIDLPTASLSDGMSPFLTLSME